MKTTLRIKYRNFQGTDQFYGMIPLLNYSGTIGESTHTIKNITTKLLWKNQRQHSSARISASVIFAKRILKKVFIENLVDADRIPLYTSIVK